MPLVDEECVLDNRDSFDYMHTYLKYRPTSDA